jgi:hypothetical protein
MHVRHVFRGRQLAVGHVEEVAALRQGAEQIPGGAVGLVVGDVAALGLEIDRNSTIFGDREDEQELLEIGAVVLVVPPGPALTKLLLQ